MHLTSDLQNVQSVHVSNYRIFSMWRVRCILFSNENGKNKEDRHLIIAREASFSRWNDVICDTKKNAYFLLPNKRPTDTVNNITINRISI